MPGLLFDLATRRPIKAARSASIRLRTFNVNPLEWSSFLSSRSSFMNGQWMIGWASAPYDPVWAQRHPKRSAWMALAGPVSNLLLVIASGLAIRIGIAVGMLEDPQRTSGPGVVWQSHRTRTGSGGQQRRRACHRAEHRFCPQPAALRLQPASLAPHGRKRGHQTGHELAGSETPTTSFFASPCGRLWGSFSPGARSASSFGRSWV